MSVEFIAPIAAIQEPALASAQALAALDGFAQSQVTGPGFGHLVADGLQQVNEQLATSQVDLQRLARGEVENLHQVMIRLEESKVAFQLMLQVRNRLLESYQEVMRMQV